MVFKSINTESEELKAFTSFIVGNSPGVIVSHAGKDNTFILTDDSLFEVSSSYIDPLIEDYNNRTRKLIRTSRPIINYIDEVDTNDGHKNYVNRNIGFFHFHDKYLDRYSKLAGVVKSELLKEKGFRPQDKVLHLRSEDLYVLLPFKKSQIDYIKTILGTKTYSLIGYDPATLTVGYLYLESERGRGYVRSLKRDNDIQQK